MPLCDAINCCIWDSRTLREIFTLGKDAISCSAQPLSDSGFDVWSMQYGNLTCPSCKCNTSLMQYKYNSII